MCLLCSRSHEKKADKPVKMKKKWNVPSTAVANAAAVCCGVPGTLRCVHMEENVASLLQASLTIIKNKHDLKLHNDSEKHKT